MAYGATPDDWAHFDLILGLGSDLLPVVSNPRAEISPSSKMKDLGKTPSRYNGDGKVVGFPGWTSHQAQPAELERWAAQADYGICVQTRTVRAIDIDVPDRLISAKIASVIDERLGRPLPMRYRENSGKVVLAFVLPGDMPKRKIVVEGGIVEFLATGQQFIAVGTHPSGARYEWLGGLPYAFPVLELEEFEALWSALAKQFAVEAPAAAGAVSVRQRGDYIAVPDPVADHLADKGLVLGEDRDGALIVACPWEHEHSTGETGNGSTVWFPAGTNGYPKGHFKCLHGHCDGRTDTDFMEAVGYVEDVTDQFDVVEAAQDAPPRPVDTLAALGLERKTGKGQWAGYFLATANNVVAALRLAHVSGFEVRFDVFRDELMRRAPADDWQPFKDADYTRLKLALESSRFEPIPFELLKACVRLVADELTFDSAQDALAGLVWDGVPRIETFYSSYLNAADTPYTRACGLYTWTALAGRVLVPGCKADMVPILVGAQGLRKSSAVEAMAFNPEWHGSLSLSDKDADLSRRMRGKVVIELPELRGLRTRELDSIKAFITEGSNAWVAKYQEFETKYPRRCLFIGSTNEQEFLDDDTGNRRWLPIPVGAADTDAIRAERAQLWAEGVVRFKAGGILYQEAEALAAEQHAAHTVGDEWEEPIREFLHTPDPLTGEVPADRGFVTSAQIFARALYITVERTDTRASKRLGRAMRALGWVKNDTFKNSAGRGWSLGTHQDTCDLC